MQESGVSGRREEAAQVVFYVLCRLHRRVSAYSYPLFNNLHYTYDQAPQDAQPRIFKVQDELLLIIYSNQSVHRHEYLPIRKVVDILVLGLRRQDSFPLVHISL